MTDCPPPGISWLEWGDAAFARAGREQRPVLLAISAAWCEACHEMDRTTWADPSVAALVAERVVPILVDSDRRPDINERYNLGGWPTTVFLTPRGDILSGGTYFTPDALIPLLRTVSETFAAHRTEIEQRAAGERARRLGRQGGGRAGLPDAAAIGWMDECLLASIDARHAGFGSAPKFPHAGDPRFRAVAEQTLDAMGWGGLCDHLDGGFYRYTASPDWSAPSFEKRLEDNATLIDLYIDASGLLDRPNWRARAVQALRYVKSTLADPADAGFFASQRADRAYYELPTSEDRRARPAPSVDRSLYCDANAAMIAVWLQAAPVLADAELGDFAIRSLERLATSAYRPGFGMAHTFDAGPAVGGLLADQVRTAGALLAAYDRTGRLPYSMLAEELMLYALRTMWDEQFGGFFDRAAAPDGRGEQGLLSERLKPLVANCEAVTVLCRLARLTSQSEYLRVAVVADRRDYLDRAGRTLGALGGAYRREGVDGAAYALAILDWQAARDRLA